MIDYSLSKKKASEQISMFQNYQKNPNQILYRLYRVADLDWIPIQNRMSAEIQIKKNSLFRWLVLQIGNDLWNELWIWIDRQQMQRECLKAI